MPGALRRSDGLAIVAMLGWGAAYAPSAWLVERWPPLTAGGARIALGGLMLLGALAVLGRPLGPGAGWSTVGLLALTQSALFYGATYWGIAHAGVGPAATLANIDALIVAGLGALVLGERLSGRQWAGLVTGLVGAGLVVLRGPVWPPGLSVDALIVAGGAAAWALGTVAAARGMRGPADGGRVGDGGADPVALAGWQMTLGGLALAAVGIAAERPLPPPGGRELGLVALLAALSSAAPLVLFYLALARSPAGEVSAWFFLIPVVGVLSAWPLLGDRPGGRLLLGLAAICLGLWLVLGRRRPERPLDTLASAPVSAPPPRPRP